MAAQEIVKHSKPFTDGKYIKNSFIKISEYLFTDFKNKSEIVQKIRDMPLSAKTVQDRTSKMAQDITKQQIKDINSTVAYSIACDESKDKSDIEQIALFCRYANSAGPQEELIELIPLKGQTHGEDICEAVLECLRTKSINTNHLVSVATDGAPSMTGAHKGFVVLLQKSLDRQLLTFHCILHQEALCAQTFPPECTQVMNVVIQITNKIMAKALDHRQFHMLLDTVDSMYSDLLLYNHHRCLKGIHSSPDTNRTGAEGLSFYYPRLLYCLDQMLVVISLSQHRVSSSKTIRPRAPCGADVQGTLLVHGLRFAQRHHTRNSVKELYNKVWWLSRGKVLKRFVVCLKEVKTFLDSKGLNYPQLKQAEWLEKLHFMVDMTAHLNTLNTALQGRGRTALHMLEDVLAFERKFTVYARDLQRGTLSHFPCLREFKQTHSDITINLECLQSIIIAMQSSFGRSFCEFRKEKKTLFFPVSPFRIDPSELNMVTLAGVSQPDFEIELADIADKDIWISKFRRLTADLEDEARQNTDLAQGHNWSKIELPKPDQLIFKT